MRDRGGADGTAALFSALNHPNWEVRLGVCTALITQGTADSRVVATLEAMSQESEAAVYDAENEAATEMARELWDAVGQGDLADRCWGKLQTIIARAREVANQVSEK